MNIESGFEQHSYRCLKCDQEYRLQIETGASVDLKRAKLERCEDLSDKVSRHKSVRRASPSKKRPQAFRVASTPSEIALANLVDRNTNDVKKVAALLNSGVTPNLRLARNGGLAFHMIDNPEILELFCQAGLHVDEPDDIGRTRLLISASKTDVEQVRILLRAGANPNFLLNTFGSKETHPYKRDLYEIPILQALSCVTTDEAIRNMTVRTVRALLAGGAEPNVKYEYHQSAKYRGKSAEELVIEADLRPLFSDFRISASDSRVVNQSKDLEFYRQLALEAIARGGEWSHGVGDREMHLHWHSKGTVIHTEEHDLMGPEPVYSSEDYETPEATLSHIICIQASRSWDRSESELDLMRHVALLLQASIE